MQFDLIYYSVIESKQVYSRCHTAHDQGSNHGVKAHGLDDGGRILETQGKGTTSRRMESLDIWTCREADHLKKKKRKALGAGY